MPHVHEVALPDGTTVITGPDFDDAVDGPAPELEEVQPGELRAKSIKATELPAIEADEAAQASEAIAAADFTILPAYGQEIFKRMRASTLRWSKNQRAADAAGWRAIRQKYRIVGARGERRAQPGTAKSLNLGGTPAGRQGSAWLVRITEERDADLKYERVEQIPVPGLQGVQVSVGWSPMNHRNPISVLVPDRHVSGGHGMAGAAKFVRDNWPHIWRTAKGLASSTLVQAKRMPAQSAGNAFPEPERPVLFKRFRGSLPDGGRKFVTDPRAATQQIAYAENYRPWEVDLQGEYATEAEVEAMGHGFLERKGQGGEMHARWTMPDGKPAGVVVESFIARRGDPDFTAGSWVTGIKFADPVWERIQSGEYIGTSIGGLWARRPVFARGS
ncbi:MAG: XkdF-like putative serine protease domain-containing protein [Acidimicrobiia bacterium]|nr:XkdF-like putative serine protease domain-containing protein [Acidimicrobiia bacterium]